MSALKNISDTDDEWVDIEAPQNGDDEDRTIGYFEGEPINVGFSTDEDVIDGDQHNTYLSGPYTVELRYSDDKRQVRVSSKDITERSYSTKIIRSKKGYYELSIPSPLVRHLELDEVLSTEKRTVNKSTGAEEQTIKRGVYVAIETACDGGQVSLNIRREDEDMSDYSHVRRIQRKPVSDGYTQYYIYFPRTIAAVLGLDDAKFNWRVDGDVLRGDVIGAACFNLESEETSSPEYDDLTEDQKTLRLRARGANSQTRLVLNSNQSKALNFDERRDEILQQNLQVAFLLECGPNGFTVVAHPNPEELPEYRLSDRNTVNVNVNNWFGSYEGSGEEPLASKRERAGNQIALNFPKDVAHSVGLTNTELVWRPVVDNFYGTDSVMLIGRPVENDE